MSFDIRLPNITAADEAGQLSQMRSYLYQFAEQLKWALNTLENNQSSDAVVLKDAVGNVVEQTEEAKAQDTFNSIKSLIIKSADIVEAYYDEIDSLLQLSGKYVAQSEFGTYTQETEQKISATSTYVQQNFYNKETVDGRFRNTEGYIRSGIVGTSIFPENDTEIGIEIGNYTSDNESNHERFARYTAKGVELFASGKDQYPVAYLSQGKLYITSAEFISGMIMGNFSVDFSKGIAFKPLRRAKGV